MRNYKEIFNTIVDKTAEYLIKNNLKSMILGISGGIDSTVCAAICHEVSKKTDIPLIGRSLPMRSKNKPGEISAAKLVGEAFCSNFKEISIEPDYIAILNTLNMSEGNHEGDYDTEKLEEIEDWVKNFQTPIANGNIQARLRMIYLYNLASIHKGLVIDTDNLTEHYLGYFTLHGDQGDLNPIGNLWKTEVFELAEWIFNYYDSESLRTGAYYNPDSELLAKMKAIKASLKLKPTAGLGITDSDLDEIGAESYEQVDRILKTLVNWLDMKPFEDIKDIPQEVQQVVADRYFKSAFKRKQLPIKIEL